MDGRVTDGPAEEVRTHLANALERDELLGAQVDQPGVEARAILRGGVDAGREGGRDLAAGIWAELDLGAVLSDEELLRGQIEDLPFLEAEHGLPTKTDAAATGAAREPMDRSGTRGASPAQFGQHIYEPGSLTLESERLFLQIRCLARPRASFLVILDSSEFY